jgi:ABC-2 type transport system permease protein
LTIALQGMTAFFAGVGHGYIAPLAWAVTTVAASQVLAVLGWGAWFPWAVPAILAGAGGVAVEPVGPGGIAMVILAAVLGIMATITWWDRADQTG